MDTRQFLMDQLSKNWQSFGQAIDDLKDSYEKCSRRESSVEEWTRALEDLDEDFIIVQEHFEMLTAIDNLYRAYIKINDVGGGGPK